MMDFERDFVADLNAGTWTSLKLLALLVALALVGLYACGCSTHSLVTPSGINATSLAILYCPQKESLTIQDGNRTVTWTSDESGVGAVVQALGDNAVEVITP